MKNFVMTSIILLTFVYASFSQITKGQIDLSKVPVPQWHYLPEYTFDETIDTHSWVKQEPGLQVAFGSTDELYLRSEVPLISNKTRVWEATGWRGERLNTQVLVWSADTTEQVRFKVSDLKSSNGGVISKINIKLNLVRYVVSNLPYGATDFDCGPSMENGWLMPDRFESFERFDLPGSTVRPVWIAYEIPQEAKKGDYTGTIEVNSLTGKVTLNVKITVQDQVLPNPHDWKFRLDLWQNPWVIAKYFHVVPWSVEHKILLKKHLKLYADAGGKYITTYAVHSPWSDNSYTIEDAMIDWTKKVDGSWQFNYSIFDQYVELAMEAGIDKAITIYTPVPWGHRFRYKDEKSGNFIWEVWEPSSPQFKTIWNIFLDDLRAHLTQKGWFGKTYLGINENPLDITLETIKVINENSKDWKITYAGDWHPELTDLLDDYSPVISSEPSAEDLQNRSEKGFTTTFYVCCTPARPNNFVFSPPIEGRYISWYASARKYDGFLRWAYDAWPADPLRDARHTLWPAGDCFMVYPGGNSCIRFEKMREGISDYEKIRILREIASKSDNLNVKKLMKDLENHLSTFIMDLDYRKREYDVIKMTEALKKGNTLIKNLSEALDQ